MKYVLFIIGMLSFYIQCNPAKELEKIEKWGVFEIELTGPTEGNPFVDNQLSATFTLSDENISVPGFYDGNGVYRIRFSPNKIGEWTYTTESNIEDLANKSGEFECISPGNNNHGPIEVVNTYYLQYADGSPFYSVGTTAYQWTSVKQSIQDKTIETLKTAPFNKIRMCVFPKSYKYGNETEPWIPPFEKKDSLNDFTQPNYAFFQNFDKRVAQLMEMGIQADVILFHPYDHWGYSKMGKEMNEKYVRYMIARLSAYRNVWWSLANEWDVPRIKETIDWEGIGTVLQNEDPHQRLRGIHNWYNSEDHFYDHSRAWITHISAQTSQFYNSIKWRDQYKKPLLLDEMRYEGDVPSGWGNLSGQEMTSYFWMAGLSGGYPTHGETIQNNSDSTEVRWWAKGGTLVGESPERIAYFKALIDAAPVQKLTPTIIVNGDAEDLNDNIYMLSSQGEYYLSYVVKAGETIEIGLTGTSDYQLDIIDTWNMNVIEQSTIQPGNFNFKTSVPYTALRIYSQNE